MHSFTCLTGDGICEQCLHPQHCCDPWIVDRVYMSKKVFTHFLIIIWITYADTEEILEFTGFICLCANPRAIQHCHFFLIHFYTVEGTLSLVDSASPWCHLLKGRRIQILWGFTRQKLAYASLGCVTRLNSQLQRANSGSVVFVWIPWFWKHFSNLKISLDMLNQPPSLE